MEYRELTEHAHRILQNPNIEKKHRGLSNLLTRIKDTVSDDDIVRYADDANVGFRFNGLRDIEFGTQREIVRFVDGHIADILDYESDTDEQKAQRLDKLNQYKQTVSVCFTDTTKPHPDRIYCQYGSYKCYHEYRDNDFFNFCLHIKRKYKGYDFTDFVKLVCLYIAIKKELSVLTDEMQLLGYETPDKAGANNTQRIIDEEKMKEYLIPEIFTKKGKQRSKADELISILKTERTQIEIAEIAIFIQQNHLLNEKYKHSIYLNNWLPVFYEIAGIKKGYNYRQNEIKSGNLTQQLTGLFPKQKNHK